MTRIRPSVRALVERVAASRVAVGDVHRATLRAAARRGLVVAVDAGGRPRPSSAALLHGWREADVLVIAESSRERAMTAVLSEIGARPVSRSGGA